MSLNFSYAEVSLNYPGWVSEDKTLPGIPSKNLSEYKAELKSWSRKYQAELSLSGSNVDVELSDEAINAYIDKPLNIGFDSDVYINVDGVDQSLNIKNYQIRDQMRDLIFLISFKKSIADWNERYVTPIGTNPVVFSESYERAMKIFEMYREYIGNI